MPANLTPEYRAADAKFRAAKTIEERIAALDEMLATIPKHKGTEKMQADLKRRMARLRQEEKSHAGKHGFSLRIDPEGAAQVALLGPPNAGKSSLLGSLTHARPHIAEYPFTTTRPQPGMMPFEDVHVQLIDLPPITTEHMDAWLPDIIRSADGAVLVADPTSTALPGDLEIVRERLSRAHVVLCHDLPQDANPRESHLRTLLAITKADLADADTVRLLGELYAEFPQVQLDVETGRGIEEFKRALWQRLDLIRVYAKPPGKPVDREAPFVLERGATVMDLAERIHRELSGRLQFARIWGGHSQGLRAARDFVLRDGDVVELHF